MVDELPPMTCAGEPYWGEERHAASPSSRDAGGDHHPVPGPCQHLPELPVPLLLGQRHLAMEIFAKHSVANQAGFASPHPS
jgi:hypothetical protein